MAVRARSAAAIAALAVGILADPGPPVRAVEPGVPGPAPIYRLRVTVATTAREIRLRPKPPATLIQGDVRRATGELVARWGTFGRGPLLLSRRAGARRATASYVVALTPGDARRLQVGVGAVGEGRTRIRVANLNRIPGQRIATVEHSGPGRKHFALPLGAVAEGGPVPGTEPLPPSVLAFYYPWYEPADWDGGKPIAGYNRIAEPYSSGDAATLERHVAEGRAAGLDGFLVSWWGRDVGWDSAVRALAERLPPDLSFALYVETFSPEFRTESDLIQELDYALDTYAGSPRYLRIDGRPVLYAFSTHNVLTDVATPGTTPGYEAIWQRVLAALKVEGHDPILVGEGRPFAVSDFDVFGGMHVYGTEDPSRTATLDREMALTARAWAAIHGGPRRIWAASVIPGYDDRHITSRIPTHFPREDGRLYSAQWEAAVASHSDQVLVVSFNEWMETTNIEPNTDWGTRYLALTAALAARFRTSR